MAKNRVTYRINDEERTYLLIFEKGKHVGEFLEAVRQKQKSPDLDSVNLDGAKLDNDDDFDEWLSPGAVFQVKKDQRALWSSDRYFVVKYAIDLEDATDQITLRSGQRVHDFRDIVKRTRQLPDVSAVCVGEEVLGDDDLFDDWFSQEAVFRVLVHLHQVSYVVDDDVTRYKTLFPKHKKVSQFLEAVKAERGLAALSYVFLDDELLGEDAEFDDSMKPGAVFQVLDSDEVLSVMCGLYAQMDLQARQMSFPAHRTVADLIAFVVRTQKLTALNGAYIDNAPVAIATTMENIRLLYGNAIIWLTD
jgi:hypothetical protein